jgi:hypothetical protein
MWMIWCVLLGGVGLGVAMAMGHGLPVSPGLLGAAAMVAVALAARRRWFGLDLAPPGSPERTLWVMLGSNAVIGGHLVTALAAIGSGMVMHSAQAHALGIDSWTLVAGGAIAWAVARDPEPRHDERDAQIAHVGLRWAHGVLVALLIAGLVPLGFGWGASVRALSHPMIAHLVIVALLASVLVDAVVRLGAYRRDAALADDPGPLA